MRAPLLPLLITSTLLGCGPPPPPADGPEQAQPSAKPAAKKEAYQQEIPSRPERPAPEALSKAERKELKTTCNLLELELYDARTEALRVLDFELANGASDDDAEKKAFEVASKKARTAPKDLVDASTYDECLALWEKGVAYDMYAFDPIAEPARAAVNRCVDRVFATFGNQPTEYADPRSSFCPDDLPVPRKLTQLPYTSSADDWAEDAWKCLGFAVRGEQKFQLEYFVDGDHFQCTARYLPRQGGLPVELRRGGGVKGGNLQLDQEVSQGRMEP